MIVGHSGSYRGTVGRAGPGIANNSNLDARLFRERDPIVATDGASRGAAEAEDLYIILREISKFIKQGLSIFNSVELFLLLQSPYGVN